MLRYLISSPILLISPTVIDDLMNSTILAFLEDYQAKIIHIDDQYYGDMP